MVDVIPPIQQSSDTGGGFLGGNPVRGGVSGASRPMSRRDFRTRNAAMTRVARPSTAAPAPSGATRRTRRNGPQITQMSVQSTPLATNKPKP